MTNLAWTMILFFGMGFAAFAGAVASGTAKLNKIAELYDEIAILREKHNDPKARVVEAAKPSTEEVLCAA